MACTPTRPQMIFGSSSVLMSRKRTSQLSMSPSRPDSSRRRCDSNGKSIYTIQDRSKEVSPGDRSIRKTARQKESAFGNEGHSALLQKAQAPFSFHRLD